MKNKTAVYQADIYDIGAVYEFSIKGIFWVIGSLASIECEEVCFFKDERGGEWPLIRESQSTIGTITPAPLELIHGNAYTFSHPTYQKPVVGIYNVGTERFIASNLATLARTCTGIREMIVKEGD